MIWIFNKLFPRNYERVRVSRWKLTPGRKTSPSRTCLSRRAIAALGHGLREHSRHQSHDGGCGKDTQGDRDQDPGGVRAWGGGRTPVRPALAVKGHKAASFSASCWSHYTPGKHMCPHPCLPAYGHPCAFYFTIKVSQNTYEIGTLIVYRPWAQSSLHA